MLKKKELLVDQGMQLLDAEVSGPSELRYLSPTDTGTAFNGKDIATLSEAAANLHREGAIWKVGPNNQITYTFLDKDPTGLYNSPKYVNVLGDYVAGFSAFSAEQRVAARDSLQLWDDLIAPRFVEKNGAGAADISFMNTSTGPAQAAAFTPFYAGGHGKFQRIQGDTFINQDQPDNFDLDYGGYGQTTLVHEIGHAIGLEHVGDYNFSDDNDGDGKPDPITYKADAFIFQDSVQYSIMSYFHAGNTGAKGFVDWASGGFGQTPQTPMLHDIAAVQEMYGADLTTRTGDTIYGFGNTSGRAVFDFTVNTDPFVTIYDAGGRDTLDLSGFTGGRIVLDLRDGALSTGYNYGVAAEINVALGLAPNQLSQTFWNNVYDGLTANPAFLTENIGIAYGTIIEDGRTGSRNDVLRGNAVANKLDAGAGNDILDGAEGADRLTGGLGSDRFDFTLLEKGDTITDFQTGVDKINLTGIRNAANTGSFDFTWIGDAGFSGVAGQLRFANGVLEADANGDRIADLSIFVEGSAPLVTDIMFA